MKTKAFLIGILGLLLAFSMVLAGCESATGGGGGDNGGGNNGGNNNNDDDKKDDPPPAPTTGTLVITNTSLEYFMRQVDVRESGEIDIVERYRGGARGQGETIEFTLPPGAYDITLRDDTGYWNCEIRAVTVRVGQATHLTFNGSELIL
jgi:hypothetical protein